jgi:hypothetical protein
MKKAILLACISICIVTISCNNEKQGEGTHQHDDGSTHTDHDTTAPKQEEFTIGDSTKKDTTGDHTHEDGKKHSH